MPSPTGREVPFPDESRAPAWISPAGALPFPPRRTVPIIPWNRLSIATPLLLTALLAASFAEAAQGDLPADSADRALAEVARVREGLKIAGDIEDLESRRWSYSRPAVEVEGWRLLGEGERWPVDQATYDERSGLLSKYVNFQNASRRKAGEAILPMGSVSSKADGYLHLLFPRNDLSLEGIERFRVRDRESVYYEFSYSPQPVTIPLLQPLVRILVDSSTGNLYRYELAADFLEAGNRPSATIGGLAAGRIAALFLRDAEVSGRLGKSRVSGELTVDDIYYIRPNTWLGAEPPGEGRARPAWLIRFRTEAEGGAKGNHRIFVDAVNGRIVGGSDSPPQ